MRDNSSQNGTLTPGQVKAINGLLYSTSVKQASELSGISARSIHRWLHDESFKSELARARENVRRDSVQTLRQLFCLAVDTLKDILSKNLLDSRVRLKACEIVLNYNIQVIELGELDSRLRQLESRTNESNNS